MMLRRAIMFVLGFAVLGAASGFSLTRARVVQSQTSEADIQYMPSGEVMRILSFGFEDVVADALWFRSIQYYGEWHQGSHGMDFYANLVDAVVTLDPNFEDAYRFAGQVIANDMGEPDLGIALLERGMTQRPDSWWLPFEAGFIEYTVRVDDAAAFRWFKHAADLPDAPDYPRRFAAFVGGRAGELQVSYELWKYIVETTDNDSLRDTARDYVDELGAALRGEAPVPEWALRRRVLVEG